MGTEYKFTYAFPIYWDTPTQWPHLKVELAWSTRPTETPDWEDITAYCYSINTRRGRQHELERVEAGTADIELDNTDRRFDPTYTAGPYYGYLKPMRRIRVRAIWNGWIYGLFSGYVEEWPPDWRDGVDPFIKVKAVDAFKVLALPKLNASYTAKLSGARVQDILDAIGFTGGYNWLLDSATNAQLGTTTTLAPSGDRWVMAGQTTIQASTLADTSALQHLQDVEKAEYGVLFMDGDGVVRFYERHYRYRIPMVTPIATFSDTLTGIHYSKLEMTYGDSEIYNDVRMKYTGGTIQTASNAASQLDYFKRTLAEEDLLASSNSEMKDRADWELSRRKDPMWRTRAIEFDCKDPAIWPYALQLEINDRITVDRTPTVGNVISESYWIGGVNWDIARGQNWKLRYALERVDPTIYWIMVGGYHIAVWPYYSTLGTNTVLAY